MNLQHCSNGGCTRPIYRGKYCFRCWAGVKWTSIVQRVENRNGNNPSYQGIPIEFTKEQLIQWVLNNPPPQHLIIPSIDRIESKLGYVPNNIQWIERNKNSAGERKNVPDGLRICPKCNQMKPLNRDYFHYNNGQRWGKPYQTYCIECRRKSYG